MCPNGNAGPETERIKQSRGVQEGNRQQSRENAPHRALIGCTLGSEDRPSCISQMSFLNLTPTPEAHSLALNVDMAKKGAHLHSVDFLDIVRIA